MYPTSFSYMLLHMPIGSSGRTRNFVRPNSGDSEGLRLRVRADKTLPVVRRHNLSAFRNRLKFPHHHGSHLVHPFSRFSSSTRVRGCHDWKNTQLRPTLSITAFPCAPATGCHAWAITPRSHGYHNPRCPRFRCRQSNGVHASGTPACSSPERVGDLGSDLGFCVDEEVEAL
jgi:hypothetical protein